MIQAPKNITSRWNDISRDKLHARSLAATRYVDLPNPDDSDEDKNQSRRKAVDRMADAQVLVQKARDWEGFVDSLPKDRVKQMAFRLEARLIINAAGGVLENGGLQLDRTSGIPYLPGSALKGIARAQAMRCLRVASEPEVLDLLEKVARVFGFGDQEWKPGRKSQKDGFASFISDFWWGLEREGNEDAGRWEKALAHMRKARPEVNWKNPASEGSVVFLPAFPDRDPGVEADVITVHHKEYYSGKKPVATDDESPVPVVIPVVSAQKQPLFLATLYLRPGGQADDLKLAAQWLADGLCGFGAGAKTAAGYGWFTEVTEDWDKTRKKEAFRRDMQADPSLIEQWNKLKEPQLRGLINQFEGEDKFWPKAGKEADEVFQYSLFFYLTATAPALYLAEKEKGTKSKVIKGLTNLSRKFKKTMP